MSRRLSIYRTHKRESVDETMSAILYAHRSTKNIGRRKVGELQKDTSIITQHVPSSLPIGEEKALRLAQSLHRKSS